MRILHVNKFLYRRGGAEGYMLDLAALQRDAGHTVEFFGMQHPENDEMTYREHFPSNVELDPPPTGVKGRAEIAARMMYSSSARKGLDEVVQDFQPDVVHHHNIYHQLSPSILRALTKRNIASVMTLHDYKLACPTYQMLDNGVICESCVGSNFSHAVKRRCNRQSLVGSALVAAESTLHRLTRAYAGVDRFICPSDFLRSKMVEAKVYPERMIHVPHFAVAAEGQADGPGQGVIVAGRLSSEKGIDVLIDAMTHLPADVKLTIAGDGPEREALQGQAAKVAPDRIEFTGRLGRDELHRRVRESAVLVIPSRWYENQPMIILEAFGCETPVVGTSLGGIPELIAPGVDGALAPHNDPAGLAAAILPFTADPAWARSCGQAGKAKVTEDFSVARHLEGVEAVYRKAQADKAGAS